MNNLALDEIVVKRRELRKRLSQFISDEIDKFKEETGVNITGVSAHFTYFREMGQANDFPVLSGVSIDTNFDQLK
jgi:hypothetical protein